MTDHRLRALSLFAAIAFAFLPSPASPASAGKAGKFDGAWHMVLVTTSGHCGVINIGMAVNGGQISATSGRFVMHKIALAGRISGSGAAKINGVAGPRQAVGTGKFTKMKGSGKWNGTGPSGVCSGIWTAVRA